MGGIGHAKLSCSHLFIHEFTFNHKDIQTDVMLMNHAKAFDKVPHKCLYSISYTGMIFQEAFITESNPF